MSIRFLKRRVSALEAKISRGFAAGTLTSTEIEDILRRVENGESLSKEEGCRIEAHGHLVGRHMIISVHQGSVTIKRYFGVDMDAL